MFAYVSDHFMRDLDSPISLVHVFLYQPGMPYRVVREGGKRGSGGQGLVGNGVLHYSVQAYEVWPVLSRCLQMVLVFLLVIPLVLIRSRLAR